MNRGLNRLVKAIGGVRGEIDDDLGVLGNGGDDFKIECDLNPTFRTMTSGLYGDFATPLAP